MTATSEQEAQKIRCEVCPRKCWMTPGQVGRCHARGNVDGEIVSLNYGKITSIALDPVEKKPFAQWNPGAKILSVGSFGCNLECPFCQNADISQVGAEGVKTQDMTPEQLVQEALDAQPDGNIGIAFTYNEPLVGYEFVRDTAKLAHEKGLKTAVVTNGLISEKAFKEVLPYIDAINIDLKGFTPRFYLLCGHGDLEAIEQTIQLAAACPTCHVEITSLVVPQASDPNEMEAAANWLTFVDKDIPYHVTQYHPAYKMAKIKALPDSEVREYAARARTYLTNVYEGNM